MYKKLLIQIENIHIYNYLIDCYVKNNQISLFNKKKSFKYEGNLKYNSLFYLFYFGNFFLYRVYQIPIIFINLLLNIFLYM